jgi:hypothetical protein
MRLIKPFAMDHDGESCRWLKLMENFDFIPFPGLLFTWGSTLEQVNKVEYDVPCGCFTVYLQKDMEYLSPIEARMRVHKLKGWTE